MDDLNGRICPRCRTPIQPGEDTAPCPDCHTPYHARCFKQGECAVCNSQPAKGPVCIAASDLSDAPVSDAPLKEENPGFAAEAAMSEKEGFVKCLHCGHFISPDERFCQNCGMPRPAEPENHSNRCRRCGTPLPPNERFCPTCGANNPSAAPKSQKTQPISKQADYSDGEYPTFVQPKKRKNGIAAAIIFILVLILGAVTGFLLWQSAQKADYARQVEEERERRQSIIDYVNSATDFCNETTRACEILEEIGASIETEWKSYVYDSDSSYQNVNEAVQAAELLQADNIDECRSKKDAVDSLYLTIESLPDASNEQLAAVQSAAEQFYSSFADFYEHVISPAGNYAGFTSTLDDLDEQINEDYQTLKAAIEAVEIPSLNEEDFELE